VEEMITRIHQEVPFILEPQTGSIVRISPAPRKHRFRREDLMTWAQENGLCPPFLFADSEGKGSASSKEGYSEKEEATLLKILSAVLKAKYGPSIVEDVMSIRNPRFGTIYNDVSRFLDISEKTLRKYLQKIEK
jgi:hypothetical protein